jgi:hypothetical protein
VIADDTLQSLARHWDDGWNGGNLEVIMAPFAEDVVFSSTFSQRDIVGYDSLREYCAAALERSGDVRYTLHDVYSSTETVILVYTCHLPTGDRPGADLMRVNGDGKVVEWRSHYTSDPTKWRE